MAPHFRSDLAEGILRSWHPTWVTTRARCRTRQARRGAIASVVAWTAGYETRAGRPVTPTAEGTGCVNAERGDRRRQAMGRRRVPSRCRARRARCGPLAGCCRARRGAHSLRRAAGRRSRRHEPPIRRQARARSSRTEAACEAAAACCTRRTTTPRRPAPASSSASSDVGWTTELRSPAGSFLSYAQLCMSTRASQVKRPGRNEVSRDRHINGQTGVSGGPICRPYW